MKCNHKYYDTVEQLCSGTKPSNRISSKLPTHHHPVATKLKYQNDLWSTLCYVVVTHSVVLEYYYNTVSLVTAIITFLYSQLTIKQ